MPQGEAVWLTEGSGPALWDVTLGAMLDEQAGRFAERPALIFDDPDASLCWTYAELRDRADRLARALMAWGVAAGEHVAVLSPNSPEWVLLEYALGKIGAVLVTVNPAFRQAELDYFLRKAGSARSSRWRSTAATTSAPRSPP